MNSTSTPKAPAPDIAGQILFAMRNMGVAPIPRNYNLFYEAYIGSNPALTRELAALGSRATQEEMDELGSRYFDHNHGQLIEAVHTKLHSELDALLLVLRHEQTCLENYNRILDETRAGITDKNLNSAHLLRTAISLLADATGNKITQNESTSKDFDRHAEEMQQVRLELDEYKRIANTDSLTRLANRRAFDDRLASIYDTNIGLHFSALVLLDVDNFKRINDTFGHPVGDKILATVASVIRANVRKDGFVARSGGEEFAIILEGNSQEEIHVVCERIRMSLEKTPFRNSKSGTDYGQVTISIGYSLASQAQNPGELYACADTALYQAKETGRNRTVFFEDGMQKNYANKSWLIYKK
ncbi:GGDEF domain-containing protein [Agrobacterium sp. rho-13.3]|jgi:diguanylate cyclase|uniref:GGDEF domain-containing protein n=1 Tax=Agrobacterium sp. rho-13.3 TaxID=3072980 RepID=UPI002A17289E|nr:GGDEF domain-containing protein [Agrobacterium sp. rho-13.3]MDX8311218.1 GGDEF domain-containing protein [Agrobacterium sp. rho-13.3]